MSKKKWILILCSIVVLFAVAAGCTLQWFYSPGVHILFGYVHVETSATGYLYQNGNILQEIDFSINTTVPFTNHREKPDDKITLEFGDLLSINSPDPEYTFCATVIRRENGYTVSVTGQGKEFESYSTNSDGAMTDIVYKYHSFNWLYLDENGKVLTFHHQPSEEGAGYMLVFTDDPIQASKDIAEATK